MPATAANLIAWIGLAAYQLFVVCNSCSERGLVLLLHRVIRESHVALTFIQAAHVVALVSIRPEPLLVIAQGTVHRTPIMGPIVHVIGCVASGVAALDVAGHQGDGTRAL